MNNRQLLRAAGVTFLAGAVVSVEFADLAKKHAEYNVPASNTVPVADFTPTSNVVQGPIIYSGPLNYQTLAQGKMILVNKG